MTSKESPSFPYLVLSLIEEAKAHPNVAGMNSVRHECTSNDLGCRFNCTLIMLPAPFVHIFEQMLNVVLNME